MKLRGMLLHRWVSGVLVLGMLLPWVVSGAVTGVETARQSAALHVICAPDTPVAHPGESITVRAWAMDASGKPAQTPVKWTWTVSTGKIDGGEIAKWSFGINDTKRGGTKLKTTAKVSAISESLGQSVCELTVYIAPPEKTLSESAVCIEKPTQCNGGYTRGQLLSEGRSFLLPGVDEPRGYGLYSYLLFDAPPDETERERHLGAIESYLRLIQPMAEMERYRRASQMNLALLPINKKISLSFNPSDPNQVAKAAEQVLAVYDYARAKSLLADLASRATRSGPYLVSRIPSGSSDKQAPLFFDMSRVLPSLVSDWVRTFYALANQEYSWTDVTLSKLALNTRNVLAVAARDTPEVVSALAQWIQVVKSH